MTITALNVLSRDSQGFPIRVSSDNSRYQWFSGQDGYLHDATAGRSIYQMAYLKPDSFGADPLPPDVEADARAFWKLLEREVERVGQERALDASSAPMTTAAALDATEVRAQARKAAEFDRIHNEGGEGFNPYRRA